MKIEIKAEMGVAIPAQTAPANLIHTHSRSKSGTILNNR
jgi:hypothetical protein